MNVFLAYAARGRNAWWRYLLVGLGTIAGLFALAIAVIVALMVMGVRSETILADMTRLVRPSQPLDLVYTVLANFGVLAVIFVILLRLLQGKRVRDLIGYWKWSAFLTGFLVWGAFVVVGAGVDYVLEPAAFHLSLSSQTLLLAVCALAVLPFQTLTEEVLFRGWLAQGLMLATKRPWVASVVAGALFGAAHLENSNFSAAAAVVFGIVSTRIAIRLGGVAFTFGVHLANNLFGSVVVVSSADVFKGSPAVFTQTVTDLGWTDVGAEAVSLLCLLLLVLGPLGKRLGPPQDTVPQQVEVF